MAGQSAFETLSTEIFDNIISQIDRPQDLSALCLTSRTIYQRAVPTLYKSWSYYGLKHSRKSLRIFLQTVIWRPDLAAHVRMLDVREWGYCPRLEDQHDCPWGTPNHEVFLERDEPPANEFSNYDFETYDERADEDYDDSDAQSYGSDSSMDSSDSGAEDVPEEDSSPLPAWRKDNIYDILKSSSSICHSNNEIRAHWDRAMHLHFSESLTPEVSQILQTAAIDAGLDRNVLIKHHASIYIKNRCMAVLVAHLLASLPNLQHLLMVFTEPGYWTPEEKAIQQMLEKSFENEDGVVLQNLETVDICSALHLGPVDDREYYLQLEYILPFMRLQNLRSLRTLAAHTFMDRLNFEPPDIEPYKQKSSITNLVLDEADLFPSDAIKTLSVFKALERFRWSQEFACFSIGSCDAPFHTSIGEALKAHRDTLVDLDLDIRHRYCKDRGHAANPYATADYPLPEYIWNPELSIRPPRCAILIGSLTDFTAMRTLSIDATALCGHQQWVPAPVRMVDALPPNLETLNLRVILRRADARPPSSESDAPSRIDNTFFVLHLIDLVRNAEKRLPSLKNVGVLIHGRDWPGSEDDFLFKDIEEECLNAGLKLKIEDEPFGTKVPYFQEQTKNWWLGRDYWHQHKPLRYIH